MANEFKVKKGLIIEGSSGTVLDVQGSVGQLFSITDSLTGDLFAVSDVSGIPILNVNSSGAVDIDGDLSITDDVTLSNFGAGYLKTNTNGVVSNTATIPWATVSSTPTTISGYGITDALAIGTTATTAMAGNTAFASTAQGTLATNAAPKGFESFADLGSPDAITGTWVNASTADWGTPRIGSSTAKYTDSTGYIQFDIPTGMKSAYLSQLTWSSGGYFYIYGIQSDGGAVLLRVVNSKNSIENTNEGNPNQHDGSTTVFAGTGLDNYSSIRIQNKSGRLHLTGLGFTSAEVQGSEGMGLVHPNQLSVSLPYSSLSGTPTIPSGNAIIDWTADQGSTNIHSGNYTNTTYSAGSGLDLTGTTFSIESDLRDGITKIGKDSSNYIAIDADDNNSIDFYVSGVWVARMEADGDLHVKGDVIAFSNLFTA